MASKQPAALSTMWMQGRYSRLSDFAQAAQEAGFHRFELSHIVTPDMFEGFYPGDYCVVSLHAPCPNALPEGGHQARDVQLAALDEQDRALAVKMASATIDMAYRYGATAVVLHLGHVDIGGEWVRQLRKLYAQGKQETRRYRALQAQLVATRILRREPCFAAAMRSLAELRTQAQERGIKLGVENRLNYHEIPSLEEMKDILSTYAGDDTIYYWHDTGHAQVQEALGFARHESWLRAFSSRTLGVHLHDVQGIRDHLTPGAGDLDFGMVRSYLPAHVIPVCEFDFPHSLDELRTGREHLVKLGLAAP